MITLLDAESPPFTSLPRLRTAGCRRPWLLAVCSVLTLLAAATARPAASTPPAMAADRGNAIAGMWWILDYQANLVPAVGGELPFTTAGRERYEQNRAQLASGELADPGTRICLPQGLPRTLFAVYPLQIVEHGQYVTFIHEVNHTFWSVALGGQHSAPGDADPAFMGESIGHWDHGALLVDSTGFKARSFLDDTGLPHSDKLHVMLRIRRLSPRQLEVIATIDDPDIFTSIWSARRLFEYRPDVILTDFVCGEPHRTLTGSRAAATPLKWVPK